MTPARRPTPRGQVDVNEAARLCGMTVRQFRNRQTRGWVELRGKSLIPAKEQGTHGGHACDLFDAKEVRRLAALRLQSGGLSPGWVDEYTYRDPADGWVGITDVGAHKRFGLAVRSVRRWRDEPCRFNAGQVIEHRRVKAATPLRGRVTGGLAWVYSIADLRRVAKAYKGGGRHAEHVDADGKVWLPSALIVSRGLTTRKSVLYWASRPSRLRAGMALRSKPVPAAIRYRRGGQAEITVYLQEDMERILAGEESPEHGPGRWAASSYRARRRMKQARPGPAERPTGQPAALPASQPAPPAPKRRGRRGRPRGWRDPVAAKRNEEMVKAARAGTYKSVADLARAFHVSRGRASQVLSAAGVNLNTPSSPRN